MVALVFVSHSRKLAESLVQLVRQVASQDVNLGIAAGVGPNRQEFGTDATEVAEVIKRLDNPEGVLVFMDLGSAVLSAQMAMDLLPRETQERVRFCPAAMIEGAIAAAVQASLGNSLELVYQEAMSALLPKTEQMQDSLTEATPPQAPIALEIPQTKEIEQRLLTIRAMHGLHARPAARFVQTAARFMADIQVKNVTTGKGPVTAKSLNALATLGVLKDHQILVTASGNQAREALASIAQLVKENFGESLEAESLLATETPREAAPTSEGVLSGVLISDGIAIAPLIFSQTIDIEVSQERNEHSDEEWQHFLEACRITKQDIQRRKLELTARLTKDQASIFDAHVLILEDPELLEKVQTLVFQERYNAAAAWKKSIDDLTDVYLDLEDPYLKQRAADVQDVGKQVLHVLLGKGHQKVVEFAQPVILYAEELTPTETSQLDMSKVMGLITKAGGPTSHSAILSRAFGIPAISGVSLSQDIVKEGTVVILDGFQGHLILNPDQAQKDESNWLRNTWLTERQRLINTSRAEAITRDGLKIEVVANAGSVADAQKAVKNGAEGIGLLRTEFLFISRTTAPSEEEQTEILRQIGIAMEGRPVIVRTLDVGGDKDVPYISLPPEANPFLGVRAIRMCFQRPDIFQAQLRAILQAGFDRPFKIIFPMIASVSEVVAAKKSMLQAHESLLAEQIPHIWPIDTGIMVEIPSAAVLSEAFAPHVDFFSIGTNDLTQYTLAAERGNPLLAEMADALHPAVLNLIYQVAQAANKFGKWAGVCGELAGDPLAAPILVGLGIKELSLNSGGIPKVKEIVRQIDSASAVELAQQALRLDNPAAVRNLARNYLANLNV